MSDIHRMPTNIAVIGMAARFPDASDIDQFWHNILQGKCSSRRYSPSALRQAGVKEAMLAGEDYIGVTAQINDVEYFDPAFFGFSQRDAAIMDPQFRHFFEVAWLALEDAGLARGHDNHIGVFSASGMSLYSGRNMNNYFRVNIEPNQKIMEDLDPIQAKILTEREYLPTQLSYRLNLTGPAYAVNTACSSSLVAIHQGIQSLLNNECHAALVGASAIHAPHIAGYPYSEGSIFSADGVCRPFDARANGIVGGNGVGVVVLKTLEQARRDGDRIYAVIKGSAINNDGAQKVSYTAPGVDGQKRNLRSVIQRSGIDLNHIGLIEAHGTGTLLGDPVEIGALAQTFSELGSRHEQKVVIGSVKSNIGHLDTAAGMAALIKTVCAIHYGIKPGTANFTSLNPALASGDADLFEVQSKPTPWSDPAEQRHALVCALGAGGTNGHIIVSGYTPPSHPEVVHSHSGEAWAVLCISGKSASALNANMAAMVEYLRHTDNMLDDICASQARSRAFHEHRCVVFGTCRETMIANITSDNAAMLFRGVKKRRVTKKSVSALSLETSGRLNKPEQKETLVQGILAGEIAPEELFLQAVYQRVSLPGYCFDRVRCWIDIEPPHTPALPLYHHCWQTVALTEGRLAQTDSGFFEENTFSISSLTEQPNTIIQRIREGKAPPFLVLSDEGVQRCAIIEQLVSLGHYLHQLDEALHSPLTLIFISRQAVWLDQHSDYSANGLSAMIWSALKAASHELVNIQFQWLDRADDTSPTQLQRALSHLLASERTGKELALRGEQLWHSVLSPLEPPGLRPIAMLAERDVIILAGGNGGLGRQLQAYYLSLGAREIVILSRRPVDEARSHEIDILAGKGVHLHWIEGDAGQLSTWQRVIHLVRSQQWQVKAIFHLAGVLSDAPLTTLTRESMARVLAPKMETCDQIEHAIAELKPASIILYSSLSSALGSPAQYAYAAANAYLDEWARKMQTKGIVVKSIQWGPWAGEGMAESVLHDNIRHNASQIEAISATDGLQLLEYVSSATAPVYLAARLPLENSEFIQGKMTCTELGRALFEPLGSQKKRDNHTIAKQKHPPERKAIISDLIRQMAGFSSDPDGFSVMTFSALGLDSLAITHLRKRIAMETGITLTIGELYSYPTVSALADYLDHKTTSEAHPSGTDRSQLKLCDEEVERKRLITEICKCLQ